MQSVATCLLREEGDYADHLPCGWNPIDARDLALSRLDLPLTIETVPFTAEFRASDEWRAKSPSGKVPAMEDDGLVMFESGAMVDYILDRYGEGRLRPLPGSHEDATYRQWCWFAEATLARPIGDVAQHTM